ncbi:MAG: NACHT domain-containing protein, partial [Blastocatellia bacterium]|nr:NACHT domain-containing protein [Blastocatellia bacterium]
MDPISLGTGAYGFLRVFSACARGAQDADNTAGYARRKYRLLGTYSATWLNSDFEASASTIGFTADQLTDIGNFLSARAIRPILALLAIANLTAEFDEHLVEQIKNCFFSEARRWNAEKSGSWNKYAESVWDRLIKLHQELLPASETILDLQDDIEYFEDFVNTPLRFSSGPGNYRTRFISHLVNLASDFQRLRTAFDTSENIASVIGATMLDPIFTHTELGIGKTPSFSALYVDRNFVDMRDEGSVDSSILTSSDAPFRIVLTGAPGAGKTTFVQHFRNRMCVSQHKPVFTVRCREYAATNWNRVSLIDFALDRHNAEHSDQLEHSTIRDILILGRAVLILDGLDEVTDPLRRVDLVRRINTFTAQYPLASILITSREVGYERAPVDPLLFVRVQLKEFSIEQTLAYATKWFKFANRAELTDRFIHDSDSIPDLRLNPLMLSLLCLLYRESGSIPSRRLDIYSESARLLFYR